MKSNDNNFEGLHITLPFPPSDLNSAFEMEVYVRFMRHLRHVPSSRPEIRILAAMQFVADIMDVQDLQIATTLVGLGLRAPRMSFPEVFLETADKALMREIHEPRVTNFSIRELQEHWHDIGEDKFAAFRRCYPTLAEGMFVPVR